MTDVESARGAHEHGRWPKDGRPVCFYCKGRPSVKGAAKTVYFHRLLERVREGTSETTFYEETHLSFPRCRECQEAHDIADWRGLKVGFACSLAGAIMGGLFGLVYPEVDIGLTEAVVAGLMIGLFVGWVSGFVVREMTPTGDGKPESDWMLDPRTEELFADGWTDGQAPGV